uniref:Integrase catalytic domain-containing protein n=1 Tax=Labrus bergylta TaxID=56723 RepID=A0A3Q3F5S0_9LABR
MAADVKRYVTSCSVCQLTKPCQRKPAGLMVPILPQKPWEYTGVDFVGPLPRTDPEMLTCYSSLKVCQRGVFQAWAPTYLISDRGTPFVSRLFEHVVSTLGTVHRLTTAYHPQTNATERVNRTLKTAIRAYVGDKHTSWDKFLPQICFALRTAPHESTGLSPSMMLYGRELDTPLDLITRPSCDGVDEPTLDHSHNRQKHYYDLRRRQATFAVGDLVRVKSHPRSDAQSNFTAKLAPLFTGPLRVSQKLGEVNYRLSNLDTGTDAGVFHVVNLQPFHTWDSSSSNRRDENRSGVRPQAFLLKFPAR